MKTFAKLFAFLLLLPALASAQYGGLWNTPERYNAAAVAITGGTISGVGGDTMSSDAAARASLLHGSNAYPQATVNTTGGDAKVCAGIGRRLFTIVDYSLIDAIDTVTVTVNGSASVKTAGGTDWTAATSNAATATSLATAISAISGVTAVASGSSVYITPAAATCTLTIATSMDAGEGTATSGTDGTVTVTGATPQDATYWTSSSNATLTNETNLGALTTGLTLNTVAAGVGTPSAYGGTSCTNQFPRSLNASGAATCATVGTNDLASSLGLVTPNIGVATATSINGNTWTAGTGTLTLGAGKVATVSNTLTFSGTDGSTLAVGTGGTLGTAAYTAATAYATSAQGTTADTAVQPVTGTWTPTDQSGASLVFTTNSNTYIKLNKLVVANFYIAYPVTANGSNMAIGGLPFNSATSTTPSFGAIITYTDTGLTMTCFVPSNSVTFNCYSTAGAILVNSQFSAKEIRGIMIYQSQ